jgi:hypothetical protein
MSYTYHIKQEFDSRVGATFVLYCRHMPNGSDQLIGEYSTRTEAREGMRRAMERDKHREEETYGKDRRVD